MRQQIANIIIALALSGCAAAPRTDAPAPDVRAALAERYPAADAIYSGELQFEPESPIKRVELPALAKALPGVRFFTTELRTGHYEYPQVSVAVAVPSQGPIAVYLSPTYGDSGPEFTEILKSARALGASDEREAANEIARLFALITYKGKVKKPHYDTGRFSAELWHGDLFWRRVLIEFADGRVSSVKLANSKEAAARPRADRQTVMPLDQLREPRYDARVMTRIGSFWRRHSFTEAHRV